MAIEPFGKILLGTILCDGYEVRDERELSRGVAAPKISKEMVSLASQILDTGHVDPSQFKEEFETELRKLVKRKAAGKTVEAPGREERPSNVVDLMEALQQSDRGKRCRAQIIGIEQEDIEAAIAQESENPSEQPDALEPPVSR
jgi:DNA end-binding protein Ku